MKKLLYLTLILAACNSASKEDITSEKTNQTLPSEWIKNATIYEVNLRQHSIEGNLEAFEKDLPRLKDLGVDVLWFMPIQPIGKLNRKAVGDTFVADMASPDYDKYWGSPYSISNYTAVNPRYGDVAGFKRLVKKCHKMDIKVVLDWVANHTAWDNAWLKNNEDWYTHDSTGKITDPIGEDGKSWGWTDVADLNYDNMDMRTEMIKSMQFWVKECDIDGFRCDVAMEVPVDFWEQARIALEEIKPMFMLAESEAHKPAQFNSAFDAYYGWEMHHVFNKLFSGEVNTSEVERVMNNKDSIIGTHVFPMNFLTNHDENSWNGTINERLENSWKAMAVLSYTVRGLPLIYTGQEVGLRHRLQFFEKDSVNWNKEGANEYFKFYKNLNSIKSEKAFATNSPISFDNEYENKDFLIINRGSNNDYRVILNLSTNKWQAIGHEIDITTGYEVADQYNLSEDGTLSEWGYIILKKKEVE